MAICARGEELLNATAREIERTGAEVLAVPADVLQSAEKEKLVASSIERFGGIDVLVSNAGGPPTGSMLTSARSNGSSPSNLALLSAGQTSECGPPGPR